MEPPLTSKVLRASSLKRGQDNIKIQDKIKLDRVLGLTVSSNAALDCDSTSELIAYPAGCTVVLFNPLKNIQSHVLNGCRKTVTSLALSGDGRHLATGECGHMPNVRVWDISDTQNTFQIAEFSGHKYGINCVAFSPSNKYVVSVGSQHDMIVNVWDWKNNVKIASNKVSSKVKAVSFAENGNYFVTVGNRHVKFWYLEYSRSTKYKEPVPLMGRSAILGEQRNNDFVDVACGKSEMADSTYAITKTGLLCEFNNRRLLDKWVELRTTSANCITVGSKYIFVGCAEGIVRCFSPMTLQFITTLPRTHYLGVDVAQGLSISHMSQHPPSAKYPDAVALAFDEKSNKLTCIYNDHSIYIWDVRDIKRVGKSHSFLYHSACIWGVDMYPLGLDSIGAMPAGSFVTCSSDDTIRIWNLEKILSTGETLYKRNIYSNELLKVLYVDPELTYLKDLDLAAAGSTEKNDASYDGRNGVRSIRVSPDGKHLASGDRSGNIRIHDVSTLEEQCLIEAHDAEVLCLEYSTFSQYSVDKPKLLASASRDRLIHVFSVDEGYNFLQTLDDHSSSITAVRFFSQANKNKQLQMVSCGADKSIIFRQLQETTGGSLQFTRGQNAQGKTTLYDMEVDAGQKYVLTACQDRNIRVYNVSSGKHNKTFKGSVGEDGSLIKVVLDSTGIYVATSCTDKTLCVYDYYSGECMATMLGHSELVTGLRFTSDCRHLVSASGDGCIFVWKLPHDMVIAMHSRLAQQAALAEKSSKQTNNDGVSMQLENEIFATSPSDILDPNANRSSYDMRADYRFSEGQLPLWAKKQINTISNDEKTSSKSGVRSVGVDLPKGRWAQRVQRSDGITVKSVYDSDEVIPFPPSRGGIDSDGGCGGCGSKDSSIDSGTETKCSSDYRRELMIVKRDNESTEHDGDVEDYSEGENGTTGSEKSLYRLMYYPTHEDTVSNQFTVNAMDVNELRRSLKTAKKLNSIEINASGSQDESDSEGGTSTPSAERNPLSMLSEVSSEGFDQLINQSHREKFLKNAFESLSGIEGPTNRLKSTSISSQFLERTSGNGENSNYKVGNMTGLIPPKQIRGSVDMVRKREELQRRIEETRRKLQSVGHRSSLKASQSTSDLSNHCTEKHYRQIRNKTGNRSGQHLSKLINLSKSRTLPNPKIKSNSLPLTNKIPGVGSTENKLQKLKENLYERQTTSWISENFNDVSKRPVTLILNKTKRCKLPVEMPNLSLPVSPVGEKFNSLKKQRKKCMSRFARFAQKRKSCSYFIDLEDNEEVMKNVIKSFESLPAISDYSLKNYDLTFDETDSGNGNFSDDSLESDFKNQPRRCVSDCQINLNSQTNKNYIVCQDFYKQVLSQSQESILSNASIDSFSKGSTEILDFNYNNDRHSSASFFLSRQKIKSVKSEESMLTDESDYPMFPLQKSDYHQSTDSILTDDSDILVKSAPLEILFDSHYERKRQNSETYFENLKKNSTYGECVLQNSHVGGNVLRSQSLQDTSCHLINFINKGVSSRNYKHVDEDAGNINNFNIRKSKNPSNNIFETSKIPQTMMVLNDYVAHKPPKPKQNSFRNQSLKNKKSLDLNQYSQPIEIQQLYLDKFSKSENTKKYKSNHFKNCKSYDKKTPLNFQIENDENLLKFKKIVIDKEDHTFIEKEIPKKDTQVYNLFHLGESTNKSKKLDTLEPNVIANCNVSNKSTEESITIKISRAIQGTVKLLSKEFESLVQREQENLINSKIQSEGKTNKNFGNKDAEREVKFYKVSREKRTPSGGEDSDCTDMSTMEKSLLESNSSTPLSSCTNSPKRMWPPVSRCQSYMKWSKTLPTINQSIIPSKHQFPGTQVLGNILYLYVFFIIALIFYFIC